jgi:glutamate synthase domain-containing protein 3
VLLEACKPALESGQPVNLEFPIRNINRTVGTIVSSEVTRLFGAKGLPENTIQLHFRGSAGQSLGAFASPGVTLRVEGDVNDYCGKGLSGGKIIVFPDRDSTFVAEDNIIAGNVVLYGATSGEMYLRGMAGERFCVRNSGAWAVVEGIGDHGCEYMTGGRAIILGPTGRNFAAGMSGGIAYVWDPRGTFPSLINKEMVEVEDLIDPEEIDVVRTFIARHVEYTRSDRGQDLLDRWDQVVGQFVKVMPSDYKVALQKLKEEAETEQRQAELAEVING